MNNKLDGILVRGFTAFVIRFFFFFFLLNPTKCQMLWHAKKKAKGKRKAGKKKGKWEWTLNNKRISLPWLYIFLHNSLACLTVRMRYPHFPLELFQGGCTSFSLYPLIFSLLCAVSLLISYAFSLSFKLLSYAYLPTPPGIYVFRLMSFNSFNAT